MHGDIVLLRVSNRGATVHAEDPVFGGGAPPNAVWFRYTAKAGGQTTVRFMPSRVFRNPLQGTVLTIPHDSIPGIHAVFVEDETGQLELIEEAADGTAINFAVVSGAATPLGWRARAEPRGFLCSIAEADVLVVEYLRRRPDTNPGIGYFVDFSSGPAFAQMVSGVVEHVQVLDSSWKRVRVLDTETPDRRFVRVHPTD